MSALPVPHAPSRTPVSVKGLKPIYHRELCHRQEQLAIARVSKGV